MRKEIGLATVKDPRACNYLMFILGGPTHSD